MTTTIDPEKRESGKHVSVALPAADLSKEILASIGTIVRMSSAPQFLIDRSHRVIAWSRAMEDFTGIRDEDVIGTTQHWKAFYDVKRPCLADLVVDAAARDLSFWYQKKWAESECADKAYEAIDFFPRIGKKGKWLHFTAVPIRDNSGIIIGTVESFEDLTQMKLMERALQLSGKKLHLMNSITWHEIENKITSIRGYIEISKEITKNEECMKCFEAEEVLLKKIHELLKYTVDYQKIGMQPPRWLNVGETIQTVLSLMDMSSLRMNINVNSLELFGDPSIELMFAHLLKNTLNNGKDVPEIRINFDKVPEGLRLLFEDNSKGIPLNRKKSLFNEPIINANNFYLKFIHDILEFSGMSIRETGDPDKGLRFEILVPHGAYRITGSSD